MYDKLLMQHDTRRTTDYGLTDHNSSYEYFMIRARHAQGAKKILWAIN